MKPVRVGLIGCGKVGTIHAAALRSLPEAAFVGAYDVLPERAVAFADKYGTRPFDDLDSLLGEVEAVVIGTPHPLHAGPAIRAAGAGVHVLVEKPMATTVADCDAMLTAAKRSGVVLGVISQRRFFEPVLRMKNAIDAGKIGRPALAVFTMYSWRDPAYYQSDPWRGKWDTEGGGVLINQSPHQLDLLRWCMGPVAEVTGYTRYRIEGDVARDRATIHVVDKGGVAAGLVSRAETDASLRGTKHRVATQREVTAVRGRRDGRTIVIVPEVKHNETVGLTLLHVRFHDHLDPDAMRGVLQGYQGRYGALKDAVTETEPTPGTWASSSASAMATSRRLRQPIWNIARATASPTPGIAAISARLRRSIWRSLLSE